MENGKNVNVRESGVTASQEATTEKRLIVERDKFTASDGRTMWGYCVKGKIDGRETKVDFNASDQGGYEVLDMIFNIKPTAELLMREETVTDGGRTNKYTIYEVGNVDADGDELRCRIKPARNSDKSILDYFLKKLQRKVKTDA